jgi:hypothetical protein
MKAPGSLNVQSHRVTISRTVGDAIDMCRQLGERYLWVDTLCIVQDSSKDKMWQIGRMGRIYSSAVLTIVAAAGTDADAGLLVSPVLVGGKNGGSRTKCVDAEEELQQEMRACKWNTRGWTFQERVLSTRLLIFTKSKVFFQCRSIVWSSTFSPDRNISTHIQRTETFISSPVSELERYAKLVELYSKRDLSFQSDALNAFSGIQGLFTGLIRKCNTFTYGIPVAAFDFAFCWTVDEHRPDRRRQEFPSWSWVGWQQEVKYECVPDRVEPGEWYFNSHLIRCTHERVNGSWDSFKNEVLVPRSWGDYAHSANILFEASTALLQVTLSPSSSSLSRLSMSEMYDISSKLDSSVIYGKINLDRKWVSQQYGALNFFVVRAIWDEEVKEPVVTVLMCYKEKGGKMFRVNTMSCYISLSRWIAATPKTKLISLW